MGVLLVFGAPCHLRLLAGREHGRTIPSPDIDRTEIPQRSKPLPYRGVLSFRSEAREPLAMKRRDFITLLGGAAAAWPLAAGAQGGGTRRIGVVMAYTESDPNGQLQVAAFRQQLQKLGWTEGSTIQIDFRYAADDPTRIRALAVELLGLRPDLMVSNSNFVTTILQSEVHSIPLVFVSVSDPIGSGFVKDLARPGGNVTGFANFQPSMGKNGWRSCGRLHRKSSASGSCCIPSHPTSAI